MYSRHPITPKPLLTRTKVDSPGFPSYIHCYFTLGNSNFALTRSNFCFPSDHFYNILLSITRTMFKARDNVIKKKLLCTVVRNNYYFLNINRIFFVFTFLSVQCKYCPALYINQVLLFKMLNYFFKNNISCCP